jgi:hypothetical protein
MSLLHWIRHGHWPHWAWCYMGLTAGEATRRGIGAHLFCHGCSQVDAP